MNHYRFFVPRRFLPSVLLVGILAIAMGCQPKGPKTLVEGKVTLKGSIVAGRVIFHGPGSKNVEAPIGPDGIYHIADAEPGDNKITIEGMSSGPAGAGAAGGGLMAPGGMAPSSSDKSKPRAKGKGGKDPAAGIEGGMVEGAKMGVNPPGKYKDPNGSGLKFTVKNGKNTFNIELTP